LVDTSTDLRQQALTHGIARVDAILFTHSHADHIMGLDDVRRFNVMQAGAIPAYADERTATDLRRSFSYVFNPPNEKGGGIPQISLTTITGRFNVGGIGIQPIPIFHGPRPILGFRFGNFAYLTDCNRLSDEAWPLLDDVEVLILDALRHRPHPTHFTVAEALQVVERVKPRHTYFTHVCHDLAHAATNASLPRGVELAYDGLALTIETASAFAEASSSAKASADKPEDEWK
jgi:phosphoribosyl 1,2-cyclic phosphate phosphodiesterase